MIKFFIKSGLLIFALTFLVYFNTLSGFFTSDDYGPLAVVKNPSLAGVINANIPKKGDIFIRPVSDIFWKLDYSIWRLNPLGYHLTNTTLHTLNSILVCILTFFLTRNQPVSLLAGILFSVHPIHSEAVVRLADREDLLCAFFYLLSLVTFITYSEIFKKPFFYFISVVFYPLSILSKEMGITLPVILILYGFIFKRRQKLKIYIPYFIIAFSYLVCRFIFIGDVGGYRSFSGQPLFINFNFIPFLKRIIFNIFPQLILPANCEVIKQSVYAGIIFLFVLGIIRALYFNHQKLNKFLLLFCLSFMVVNFVIIHNIIWVGPDLQGSRLLYLPTVGFSIIFSHLLLGKNNRRGISRVLNFITAMVFSLCYIFITVNDNQAWNTAGRITGQIPERAKEYALRYHNNIKLYFFIPAIWKGTSLYGHNIPETIAPLLLPLEPKDVVIISDLNYGNNGEYLFYDFDIRDSDLKENLGKKYYFLKWDEGLRSLEDISLSLKNKLNNLKQKSTLPKIYYFIKDTFDIKGIHIPVESIGAIELRMRMKSTNSSRDNLEILWLSSKDAKWDFKKHIYFPVKIDGEFHTYNIPFHLFNPDWLEEVYLEELMLQFDRDYKLKNYNTEIEYIKLLAY